MRYSSVNSVMQLQSRSSVLSNPAMDAVSARRLNLKQLEKQHGSLERLAELTESAPGHLSQIKNGTRNMGNAVARRFERKLDLGAGWMDTRNHAYPQGHLSTELLVKDFAELPPALQDHVAKVAADLRAIIESIPDRYRRMITAPPTDPERYREWEQSMRELASQLRPPVKQHE